jgi:hypothetical protein
MEQELERENRLKSGVGTALIAALICLVMWFYNLQIEEPILLPEAHEVEIMVEPPPPPPPPPDQGGSTGDGGGRPSPINDYNADPSPPAKAQEQTKDPDATKVKKTPEVNPDEGLSPAEIMAKKRKAEELKVKNDKTTNPNGPPGPGRTDGPPGRNKPGGGGPGFNAGHTFGSGRSFRSGNTTRDCHQAGKVVLEVQLMPNGKIIFLDVDPATNGSDCLIQAAREILKNSSFNESARSEAATGTITFVFTVN